jgi:predicted Zn-dependent protease with MMP-like domain
MEIRSEFCSKVSLLLLSTCLWQLAAVGAEAQGGPARNYVPVTLGTWTMQVESELAAQDSTAKLACARLQRNLDQMMRVVPEPAATRLHEVKLFVLLGPQSKLGGKASGLEYFQRSAPKFRSDIDPQWKHAIVVYCAKNYLDQNDLWAQKVVVHEMAHAWHLSNWPEKYPVIVKAHGNAVKQGLYLNRVDEKGKKIPQAYCLTNQLEYFAELSAMYFARCNYAPYDRDELLRYDLEGYKMIEKVWFSAR